MGYIKSLIFQQLPVLAEAAGTFFLVLVGTSAVTAIGVSGQATTDSVILLSALSFGLTLAGIVYVFGSISGGHVNPAVTLLAFVQGRLGLMTAGLYFFGQLAGAIVASIVVALMFGSPGVDVGLGAPQVSTPMGPFAALMAELLGTSILLVALLIAWRRQLSMTATSAMAGLGLALGIITSAGVSGGAINPARAIAPQLAAAQTTMMWVYVAGPLLAAVGLGVIARILTAAPSFQYAQSSQPSDHIEPETEDQPILASQDAEQPQPQYDDYQLKGSHQPATVSSAEDQDGSQNAAFSQSQPSFGSFTEAEAEPITYAEIVNQTDTRQAPVDPPLMADLSFDPSNQPNESNEQPSGQPAIPVNPPSGQVKFVDFDRREAEDV